MRRPDRKRPRGCVAFTWFAPYSRTIALFTDQKAYAAYSAKICRGERANSNDLPTDLAGQTAISKCGKKFAIYIAPWAAPGTLAHEIGHVIIDTFDSIGLGITHAASEAFTYALQELFDELGPAIYAVRWRKKPKRSY